MWYAKIPAATTRRELGNCHFSSHVQDKGISSSSGFDMNHRIPVLPNRIN